jgi:glycosyltransferase involved in cell wall biosynthesis
MRVHAAADVLLLPSQNEGISLAVYESMALCVTPVVSAVGGQCELVADGAGACIPMILGEALGPAQLSAAAKPFVNELQRLLKSRDLLIQRSRAARQRVDREFNIGKTMVALRRGLCES